MARRLDNPVARLLEVLQAVQGEPGNRPIRHAWATIFDVEANSTADVLRAVSDVVKLTREAREATKVLPGLDDALHMAPFNAVDAALGSVSLDRPTAQFTKGITGETLVSLRHVANQLSVVSPEGVLEEQDRQRLEAVVDEAIDTAVASDLPQQLKSVVLEHLFNAKRSLRRYQLWGTKGLTGALEGAVGAYNLREEQFKEHSDSAAVKAYYKVIVEIAAAVEAVDALIRLAEPVVKWLLEAGD
jgi:hypothetical protein